MDKRGRERRRLYRPGMIVRTSGLYETPLGTRRVALAIGERFPMANEGWHLEERMRVERPAIEAIAALQVPESSIRPILLDAAAMEYALEVVHAAGWNSALRELEAKILTNGSSGRAAKAAKAHALGLISELRIRRTMRASKEGDPDDG